MNIRKVLQIIKSNRKLLPTFFVLIIAVLILIFARSFELSFTKLMSVANYLTWHNLFEMSMVIAYLAIFLVNYYAYEQTRRFRSILIGSMLLMAGILEAFHMLSFKGMPSFFIDNTASNRATTFWILSKLIFSLAFLVGSLLSDQIRCTVNKIYFFLTAVLISLVIFITATWYPSFFPAMYVEGHGLTGIKILLEYLVMLMLLIASIIYFRNIFKYRDRMMLVMSCALMLGVLSEFAFTQYVEVYDIYNYVGHLLGACSLFMVFRMTFIRNVMAPYVALTAAQEALSEHAENQERTIEQRTRQMKLLNNKLLEDLEYARGIQKSLLPAFLPDTEQISFSAVYLPTDRLSGDFYDIFQLDERHMGFYVCDVSGHGVPAAMLTVFLKQCVDNIVETDRFKGALSPPSVMLRQVYDAYNHSKFKDDVYIVLIYCIYDKVEKKLHCSSAGMNVMPLLEKADGDISKVEMKGFPICKLSEICTAEFNDYDVRVQSGDRLYLYTDGLPEAHNSKGGNYSETRLVKLLNENRSMELSDMTSLISDDLVDFSEGKKLEDDVTLLAVEFRE
jgi:sigma-B regulation protein RsbU (phosphoserine phosphatase)